MRKLALLVTLLAAQVAVAATPSEGVALNVRRGFFTETDIGAFMVLGGADTYSNAQTYLQLVLGYDINDKIELGFSLGLGASAADCFAQRDAAGDCTSDGTAAGTPLPDNFTNVFLDMTGAYLFKLYERLYLAPRFAVGYTFLDPAPTLDNSGHGVGGGNLNVTGAVL